MSKKMLIDATHAEETRVVVVEGNKIDEFDFETITKRQIAGNIYLAKVTRVEPSLQAAFVDYGGNRHGFLAFSEIHPDYYQIPKEDREKLLEEEARIERADPDMDSEPAADADAPASSDDAAEAKPKPKRRRAPRKKKEETAADAPAEAVEASADANAEDAPVADAPVDAPVEVVAEDTPAEDAPKPKRKRAPRKKKPDTQAEAVGLESDDDDVVSEDPDDSESLLVDTPEAAAEKPKRKRAPRKKKVEAEASSDEASTGEAKSEDSPAGDDDTADSGDKPKRRRSRSRRKKSDDNDDQSETRNSDQPYESVAAEDVEEEIVRKRRPMRRFKIQEVIRVRQILLVQVVKEERGNKGAALTTYLSLAGRYCVLMPNTARGGGVSRKITNIADRKKLKEIAAEIEVPQGAGLIVRTAGARRTKTEIKRDYEYLLRLWEQIRDRTLSSIAPEMIYEEGNLIKRSIRDLYSREIDEVIVDGETGYKEAKEYMKMLLPSHAKNVKHYEETMPLFSRYQVENYLGGMMNPTVQLRSGGYLVINLTEALVAVDVNSGRATKEGSIEDTAVKTNLEAAEEVARQMRLRDLAGLIVIDFIDMEERRNNNAVEKKLKDALKTDRARVQVGRISGFGLLEMSRQRLRPGMLEATTTQCPHCMGTGYIRSEENLALAIMRELDEEGMRKRAREISVKVPISIANYMLNDKREHVAAIESRYGLSVRVEADPTLIGSQYEIERSKTSTRTPPPVIESKAVTVDDSAMLENAEPAAAPSNAPSGPASDGENLDENGRPKRRRRRRRGGRGRNRNNENGAPADVSAEGDTSPDAKGPDAKGSEAPVEAAPAPDGASDAPTDAVADEKPKPARRGRKPAAEKAAEAEAEATDTDAVEEKPKRKRAPRKKAEAAPAAEAEVVVEAASDVAAEEKPKPKRAPRKKAAAAEAEVAPEPAPEPAPAPAPEPEAAPEPAAKEAKSSKPKRAGWWSRALGK